MVKDLIKIDEARTIIDELTEKVFDSHEFIENLKKQHKKVYESISGLYSEDADRKTNSLIARFLSYNENKLQIKKINRRISKNVHGNKTSCALWKDLKVK